MVSRLFTLLTALTMAVGLSILSSNASAGSGNMSLHKQAAKQHLKAEPGARAGIPPHAAGPKRLGQQQRRHTAQPNSTDPDVFDMEENFAAKCEAKGGGASDDPDGGWYKCHDADGNEIDIGDPDHED